jgi:hypothetical protein
MVQIQKRSRPFLSCRYVWRGRKVSCGLLKSLQPELQERTRDAWSAGRKQGWQ